VINGLHHHITILPVHAVVKLLPIYDVEEIQELGSTLEGAYIVNEYLDPYATTQKFQIRVLTTLDLVYFASYPSKFNVNENKTLARFLTEQKISITVVDKEVRHRELV